MSNHSGGDDHRVHAALREEERVTPLELFFDVVFVLAFTQCTALMAGQASWASVGKGLLILALLWWTWVGYSWLTSVVDPEEGLSRLTIFVAMAALLVVSLTIPDAFTDLGMTFAISYSIVRVAHIALFSLASRDDNELRRSVVILGLTTAVGIALVIAGAFTASHARIILWAVAILMDAGPILFFGAEGWRLVPEHFAERHGLIFIVALGESIVAIGVGSGAHVGTGTIVAASLGIALSGAMWWTYFDVSALVGGRQLGSAEVGRHQNEMARDAYSFMHFVFIAGTVLVALGLKKTLAHVHDPLTSVTASALVGGTALYVLGHVAFQLRTAHTLNRERLVLCIVLAALTFEATRFDAIVTLAVLATLFWAMIAYEFVRFSGGREQVRHETHNLPAAEAEAEIANT